MPTKDEAEMMVTDPTGWINDYKLGQSFRRSQDGNINNNFAINNPQSCFSTQAWLMGDGGSDSYANMIRNTVYPIDQNYTKLNLISMVSNDIQNVTIPGLS